MRDRKPAHDGHGFAQRGLDNAVSHAHDEEEEEGERVPEGVEHGDDNHEHFGAHVVSISVLIVVEAPRHQHLQHQESNNGGDVVLDGEDIVPVLDV